MIAAAGRATLLKESKRRRYPRKTWGGERNIAGKKTVRKRGPQAAEPRAPVESSPGG
ncbi:MAG: hypothetical protein JXA20_09310 [Spirochaetes bacterium]|nr:hypothetical protein [Spirochaetota bacterium]